jgi:hypothetical protein
VLGFLGNRIVNEHSPSIIGRLFDQRMRDHDHVIEVFKARNAEVRRRVPPDRLLVNQVARAGSRFAGSSAFPSRHRRCRRRTRPRTSASFHESRKQK